MGGFLFFGEWGYLDVFELEGEVVFGVELEGDVSC